MSPSNAAKIIGCSVQHVRHLIRIGQIKAEKVDDDSNQHGYRWEILDGEPERYNEDSKGTGGFPRGSHRDSQTRLKL